MGTFTRVLAVLGLLAAFASPVRGADDSAAAGGPETRIRQALAILTHVPAGQKLLAHAISVWKLKDSSQLMEFFGIGTASRTDAVLTRHFNPKTGQETRERQVTIYLRTDQSLGNLVLDVAHEMVHATSRPAWDPYDPELTAGKYIWASIEGPGGEVEAVTTECRVALELAARFGVGASRCRGYLTKGQIDPQKIRRDFYRVGPKDQELIRRLGTEIAMFPLLSSESPKLYSSTGSAPYPIALLREFDEITQVACENSRRRELASDGASLGDSHAKFLNQRCHQTQAQSIAAP